MINIVKDKLIGCLIDKEEFIKIQRNVSKYGFKSTSEYVRAALDFFDARRYNASKNNEISVIKDCIKLLEDHKKQVENTMMQQSLNNLNENIKGQNSEKSETFNETPKNLKENLKDYGDKTFKENEENLKGHNSTKNESRAEPFENIIKTLIKLTHVKGRPTDEDFKFQASRCKKTKKEIVDYYDENYEFFVRESDKIM